MEKCDFNGTFPGLGMVHQRTSRLLLTAVWKRHWSNLLWVWTAISPLWGVYGIEQRSTFLVKGPIVNILSFAYQMVLVAATQLSATIIVDSNARQYANKWTGLGSNKTLCIKTDSRPHWSTGCSLPIPGIQDSFNISPFCCKMKTPVNTMLENGSPRLLFIYHCALPLTGADSGSVGPEVYIFQGACLRKIK